MQTNKDKVAEIIKKDGEDANIANPIPGEGANQPQDEPKIYTTLVQNLCDSLGVPYQETYMPKDSFEDMAGFIEALVKDSAKSVADSRFTNSQLLEINDFVTRGMDIEDAYNLVIKSSFVVRDLEDEAVQKAIVITKLKDRFKEDADSDEVLNEMAEASWEKLSPENRKKQAEKIYAKEQETFSNNKAAKIREIEASQFEKQEAERIAYEQGQAHLAALSEAIVKGDKEVTKFDIAEDNRKPFVNYLNKKGADGFTDYQKDINNPENALAFAYAHFLFKNGGVIKSNANISEIEKLLEAEQKKQKLARTSGGNQNSAAANVSATTDWSNANLEKLL